MNIDDMRYVLEIADQGSITKAAQNLFITQPTLSQRLQKVEKELGVRLFERNRFGDVSPTDAGSLVCTECRHILSHWQNLNDNLQTLKGQRTINMGIPVRIGPDLVHGLMEQLEIERPDVVLNFMDRPNYVMEEMVAKGELDMAFIRMAVPNGNYILRPLRSPDPVIHLRKGSPLWERVYYHEGDPMPYIDLRLLGEEPLVAPAVSRAYRSRQWLDMIFDQIPNLHPRVVYTAPNYKLYHGYALKGTASFVAADIQIPELACRLEPEYRIPYTLYMVQSKQMDKSIADSIYRIMKSLPSEK